MKKKIVYVFSLLLTTTLSINVGFAQILSFQESLDRSGMVFNLPEGFEEIPVIENKSMLYTYAIKNVDTGMEIRYRIDLVDTTDSFQRHVDAQRNGMVALTVLYNISDKSMEIPDLGKRLMMIGGEQAERDFNADELLISFISPGTDFGQDYENCGMSYLVKNGVAKAWVFILFNNKESFMKGGINVTQALKFGQ